MRRLIAIAAAALTLCGCNRYVGGFDDSYMKYSQMVLMNRSSKDISLVIGNCEWADPMDTVRLEQGNGLWKKTVEKENYYLALKTLDTLKTNLKNVPSCRLSRVLEAFIKPKTDDILVYL